MITVSQREAIRRAYHFQCGYCGVHENDAGSALEMDHFQPLTPTGALHIRRLRLNRPQLIALRQARRRATQHIARLTELETQVVEVRRGVASLEGQLQTLLEHIRRLSDQDT